MPPVSDPCVIHCDMAGDLYLHLTDVSILPKTKKYLESKYFRLTIWFWSDFCTFISTITCLWRYMTWCWNFSKRNRWNRRETFTKEISNFQSQKQCVRLLSFFACCQIYISNFLAVSFIKHADKIFSCNSERMAF